jgi:hypothetical protein
VPSRFQFIKTHKICVLALETMSDNVFVIVVLVGFAIFLLGVYAVLRFIEDRYRTQVEKIRRIFATYSVPVVLVLIFGIGFYHDQLGYVCNTAGHNTAGWTCNFSWFLIPLLLVSISISAWYWAVYRNKIDPLDRASKRH